MRYILRESERPLAGDYYYEATKTTNDHFPDIPAHTHNFYEIYIFRTGSVKLAIEDKIYNVRRGDIIVIPPFTIHQLLPKNPDQIYDRIYMYISEPCLKSFQFNEHSLLSPLQMAMQEKRFHFHIADENDYEQIYEAMFAIYKNKNQKIFEKEMMNRSGITKLVTLINKHIFMDMGTKKVTHVNPVIDKILSYINDNYASPLSLDDLAARFYINKFTMTKLFKKQTSLTIHNYILLKRISMAKQKITSGALPSKVYLETGFSDYSTFYRAFLKTENMSPKDFAHFCK